MAKIEFLMQIYCSRYLPAEFTLKQIEQMKEFVENLIEFLKSL